MSRVAIWNVAALVLAVTLSSAIVWIPALRGAGPSAPGAFAVEEGAPPLVDHSGTAVRLARYARIASLSTVADELLLELCEPDRIVAFTSYSAEKSEKSYRFAGKAVLDSAADFERLLALHPDLVLVNQIGDPRPIARMREAGLAVYDLGEMRGMATVLPNIQEVARLVGHPERGERLARELASRMEAVAADIPSSRRRRGIYLSVYGGHLYGGAAGTSYHDVLGAAGLVDAAAQYRDWPEYSGEQILALDPDVIVTNENMKPRICEHAGLTSLRACGQAGSIVEMNENTLGGAGLLMLDAADAVRAAVYGPPAAR